MRILIFGALLVLAACSPSASDAAPVSTQGAPAVHPVSGLEVIQLRVRHAGRVHAFKVEVARRADQQSRGLMFRTSMGADEGMLFPMNPPRYASFWMRNTVMPLDLVFIGRDGRILNIAARTVPYDETPMISMGVASAVLELNGGRAAELGLAPGDSVEW